MQRTAIKRLADLDGGMSCEELWAVFQPLSKQSFQSSLVSCHTSPPTTPHHTTPQTTTTLAGT